MFAIKTFNHIAHSGLNHFNDKKFTIDQSDNPDAIIVRSQDLHAYHFGNQLKAVGRAGAGINNIPVAELTKRGIPVFNTPGANANAVKELVILGILMALRNVPKALRFTAGLESMQVDLHELVEKQKKQFVGNEIAGKTLGVIGLGAIGVRVANAAIGLDMKVLGYDPHILVENAWKLSAFVMQAEKMDEVIRNSQIITLHVPLLDSTKNLINADKISSMQNVILLNFARAQIVDETAILQGLEAGHLAYYICDFPSEKLLKHPKVIALPHLGASTYEAQDNCADWVCRRVRHFLEFGIIEDSVNFPKVVLSRHGDARLVIVNQNIPNMVGQISGILGQAKINMVDMINKSKDEIAYTVIDVENKINADILQQISALDGVLSLRQISKE